MENARMMVVHALVIGVLLYLAMVLGLGQQSGVAERRSILIASGFLIYMILFGHGLPTKINNI
jgi:hypothetical protein